MNRGGFYNRDLLDSSLQFQDTIVFGFRHAEMSYNNFFSSI